MIHFVSSFTADIHRVFREDQPFQRHIILLKDHGAGHEQEIRNPDHGLPVHPAILHDPPHPVIRKGAEAFLHLLPEADQKQQMSMMRFGSQELRYMAVSWSKSEERPERRKRPPATRGEVSPRKARSILAAGNSFVPTPMPIFSVAITGIGPKEDAKCFKRAAPVGVQSSPRIAPL